MTAPVLLALLLSQSPGARTFVLDGPQSSVRFHLDHPLHKVDGSARVVEAKAVLGADGELRAMARAQVAGLDTGDANRDANMRAVLEADRHPYVIVKGTSRLVLPAALSSEVPLKLSAEVDVHGIRRPVEIPLTLKFDPDGNVRVRGTLDVSLDAHRVERPALLFKKVDDRCRVSLDLLLRPEKK
jgi:polyisoprenoid-binding protein YceI